MGNTTNKMNFLLKRASNWDLDEIISVKDIDELLSLIDKYRYPIIIEKNLALEEYERDKKRFEEQHIPAAVERVKQWKRRKVYHRIIIYDDYIE